jgi:hypothetical protein
MSLAAVLRIALTSDPIIAYCYQHTSALAGRSPSGACSYLSETNSATRNHRPGSASSALRHCRECCLAASAACICRSGPNAVGVGKQQLLQQPSMLFCRSQQGPACKSLITWHSLQHCKSDLMLVHQVWLSLVSDLLILCACRSPSKQPCTLSDFLRVNVGQHALKLAGIPADSCASCAQQQLTTR